MIDDIGWNMTNTEQNKDIFWYEAEIQEIGEERLKKYLRGE